MKLKKFFTIFWSAVSFNRKNISRPYKYTYKTTKKPHFKTERIAYIYSSQLSIFSSFIAKNIFQTFALISTLERLNFFFNSLLRLFSLFWNFFLFIKAIIRPCTFYSFRRSHTLTIFFSSQYFLCKLFRVYGCWNSQTLNLIRLSKNMI